MNVLIVPDKFKGTLSAQNAAESIAHGWKLSRPEDRLTCVPMSDGGDGFGEILGKLAGGEIVTTETIDAAYQPISADWWWCSSSKTAIIETARVIGLAMLPTGKFHPFQLDTFGLGEIFRAAEAKGATRFICGIGGSATNDGGFGLARSLGFRFLDSNSDEIDSWTRLQELKLITPPKEVPSLELIIATDVQNPLLGKEGATRIYGPQKGIRPEDVTIAESSLQHLVHSVKTDLAIDAELEPGTGAAGGLGYGLRVFLNGRFKPGFAVFAETANLQEKIVDSNLVVTAEGCIDSSSLMGKGTGAVARLAKELGKKTIGLAGNLPPEVSRSNVLFDQIWGMHPDLVSIKEAKTNPAFWLEKLGAMAATKVK